MEQQFEGYAVLEEAALDLIDAPDPEERLQFYREQLERLLLNQLGDQQLAVTLALKFTEIIKLRRDEIVTSASVNLETVQ